MRLEAVHDDHAPVARVLPDLARRAVALRVVPLAGGFHRLELDHYESLRPPTAFENAARTPTREEPSAMPLNTRARPLATPSRPPKISPLDVDRDTRRHNQRSYDPASGVSVA